MIFKLYDKNNEYVAGFKRDPLLTMEGIHLLINGQIPKFIDRMNVFGRFPASELANGEIVSVRCFAETEGAAELILILDIYPTYIKLRKTCIKFNAEGNTWHFSGVRVKGWR